MMKRTLSSLAAATTIAIAALSGAAQAQNIELKLAWLSADSPNDPYAVTAHAFKDAIEAAMPGKVSVALFPNRQLGDEKDVLENMQFGTIDMGVITNAVVATVEPSYQLLDLPFLFSSAEQAHKVLDGPVGEKLAANLEKRGVVSLGAAEGGFRNMINNDHPIEKPSDVEGVKFRTMQNPVFIDMFNSLGGSPVPMAWGEVYTAVQQGTIDGLEIPLSVVQANKFPEVVKYASMTRHTYSAVHLLISKKTLDGLPADVQAAIREAGHTAVLEERKTVEANESVVREKLVAEGMQINDVPDLAAFREKVKGVYGQFANSIGPDLLKEAEDAVAQDN